MLLQKNKMVKFTCYMNADATTGVARVEVLDVNDSPPVFIPSSLFAAVEEDVPFDISVAQLEVKLAMIS